MVDRPDHIGRMGMREGEHSSLVTMQPDPQAQPEVPLVTPELVEYLRAQFPGDIRSIEGGIEVQCVYRMLGQLSVIDHLQTLINIRK